MLSLCLVKD